MLNNKLWRALAGYLATRMSFAQVHILTESTGIDFPVQDTTC